MEPRLVIVVGLKGIRLIRMVASSSEEEDEAVRLYSRLKKKLRAIDKTLQNKVSLSGVEQ